jgi:hypothetical protein
MLQGGNMSSLVQSLTNNLSNLYGLQKSNSFWSTSQTSDTDEDAWSFLAEQCDYKVNVSLTKVGDRIKLDMAAETADYLSDNPDLADDYVLAIVKDATGGLEARAFRKSDLLAEVDAEKKEELEKALENDTLVYFSSDEGIPDTPDDEDLQGLANRIQSFLDANSKILSMIERSGVVPW